VYSIAGTSALQPAASGGWLRFCYRRAVQLVIEGRAFLTFCSRERRPRRPCLYISIGNPPLWVFSSRSTERALSPNGELMTTHSGGSVIKCYEHYEILHGTRRLVGPPISNRSAGICYVVIRALWMTDPPMFSPNSNDRLWPGGVWSSCVVEVIKTRNK
jgi:hypothetical protein